MIGSLRLEWPLCLRNENTCARRCRVWCCYTTWPTSTTRCRSAHLVFVQPNHLLSAIHIVLVMRTAASTAMPPWQATTELIKSKVDGNCVRPPTRRHSDSEDRRKSNRLDTSSSRHLIAQRVQFFKPQSDNTKSFSWGSKGDILFCEREYPLCPCRPQAAYPSAPCVERSLRPLGEKRAVLADSSFQIFVPYSVTKGSRAI